MLGGYTPAALAFSTLCVPIRKMPTVSTAQARNQKPPPPLPSTSIASRGAQIAETGGEEAGQPHHDRRGDQRADDAAELQAGGDHHDLGAGQAAAGQQRGDPVVEEVDRDQRGEEHDPQHDGDRRAAVLEQLDRLEAGLVLPRHGEAGFAREVPRRAPAARGCARMRSAGAPCITRNSSASGISAQHHRRQQHGQQAADPEHRAPAEERQEAERIAGRDRTRATG